MKKNIKPLEVSPGFRAQLKELRPKFTKEQKVVAKAHSMIGSIDKTRLRPEDRAKASYAGGLLEALLMKDDEEQDDE